MNIESCGQLGLLEDFFICPNVDQMSFIITFFSEPRDLILPPSTGDSETSWVWIAQLIGTCVLGLGSAACGRGIPSNSDFEKKEVHFYL